jgi:hypothetical protein
MALNDVAQDAVELTPRVGCRREMVRHGIRTGGREVDAGVSSGVVG